MNAACLPATPSQRDNDTPWLPTGSSRAILQLGRAHNRTAEKSVLRPDRIACLLFELVDRTSEYARNQRPETHNLQLYASRIRRLRWC